MKRNNGNAKIGCLVWFVVVIINLSIGGWSVAEILSWVGKNIPWYGDALIGFFVAEVSIPIALGGWLLRLFL